MVRLCRLFVPAAVVLAAPVALASSTAEEVARAFCDAVRGTNEAAATALMTEELQAAVARLRAADAEFRAAYPQDKPPLGDGLRLTAFPDGLETCTPEAVTTVSVDLVYAPGSDPSATWRDRLVLVPARDGGVLVADILYAPDQTALFSEWLLDAASWK